MFDIRAEISDIKVKKPDIKAELLDIKIKIPDIYAEIPDIVPHGNNPETNFSTRISMKILAVLKCYQLKHFFIAIEVPFSELNYSSF